MSDTREELIYDVLIMKQEIEWHLEGKRQLTLTKRHQRLLSEVFYELTQRHAGREAEIEVR